MSWLMKILSVLLVILAWVPLQIVRLFRQLQLRGGALVRLDLSPAQMPSSSAARARQIETLERIGADPDVSGVFVHISATPPGWAELQELRDVLRRVREAGKLVVVYMEQATNAELYLASVADRIWMPPVGDLFLTGLGGRLSFFGGILKKLNIHVQLEAAGDYKSFGEPYTRGYASPANREQMTVLYDDLLKQLVQGIARGRDLTEEEVSGMLDRTPMGAEAAKDLKLIDDLAYIDQVEEHLKSMLSVETLRVVSMRAYTRLARAERWLANLGRKESVIAVLHLEGPIFMGGDGIQGRRINARQVLPVLRQLSDDENVKAVVLRIDSGGGSALASDLIARAVQKLSDEKPVVAVYGNVVASGGYYLSVVAREIIARPGTITGSIGVVGGKIVVGEALARQGLTGDHVEVGPDVGIFGPFRSFTPDQRRRFQDYLKRTYDLFLQIVANGRHSSVEAVEPHAGGRVWTGRQARERDLIDHFGGLRTGLSRARLLADLRPGEGWVAHLDFTPTRLQTINSLANNVRAQRADPLALALALGGPRAELLRLLQEQPGQALALCPWVLDANRS